MGETHFTTVIFDGHCNLCNGSVKFIIRHDPRKRFHFASLQSAVGRQIVEQFGGSPNDSDTIRLLEDGRLYDRSSATLRIVRGLSFPLPLLAVFLVVPAPVRDFVYRWVAANRYRWFGKTDACMMPSADIRSRFLDE